MWRINPGPDSSVRRQLGNRDSVSGERKKIFYLCDKAFIEWLKTIPQLFLIQQKTLELLSQLPNSEFVFLDENYARVFCVEKLTFRSQIFC